MLVLHTPVTADRPDLHLSTDPAAVAGPLVAAALLRAQRLRGRCTLIVSADPALESVLRWLRAHLPHDIYRSLQVVVSDDVAERFATPEPGHWQDLPAASALRQLMALWLAHVPLDPRRILPMALGGAAPDECVRAGRQLQQWLREPADVALVAAGNAGALLGMEAGHPGLAVDDICLVQHGEPARVSVTPALLRQARHLFVVARGAGCADALQAMWMGQGEPTALGSLLPHAACYVVADLEAAVKLWPQPPLPPAADA